MDYLKTKDVSRLFDVSVMTIGRWVRAGYIKSIRTPSGQYRFEIAEVSRVLKEMGLPAYKPQKRNEK
jgi:excisionase family DNA binding protein